MTRATGVSQRRQIPLRGWLRAGFTGRSRHRHLIKWHGADAQERAAPCLALGVKYDRTRITTPFCVTGFSLRQRLLSVDDRLADVGTTLSGAGVDRVPHLGGSHGPIHRCDGHHLGALTAFLARTSIRISTADAACCSRGADADGAGHPVSAAFAWNFGALLAFRCLDRGGCGHDSP